MNDADDDHLPPQERAARQLVTPGALVQLNLADAREVVAYMMPRRITAGTTIFQAGDASDGDDMLLVIDGDVTVENQASPTSEGLVVTVMSSAMTGTVASAAVKNRAEMIRFIFMKSP